MQNRHSQSDVCLLDMEKFGLVLSDDEVDDDECFSITVNTSTHTHTRTHAYNSCCSRCHTFSSLTQDLELVSTQLFLEALSVSAFVPVLEELTASVLGIERALSFHLENQKIEKWGNSKKHFQTKFLGCFFLYTTFPSSIPSLCFVL